MSGFDPIPRCGYCRMVPDRAPSRFGVIERRVVFAVLAVLAALCMPDWPEAQHRSTHSDTLPGVLRRLAFTSPASAPADPAPDDDSTERRGVRALAYSPDGRLLAAGVGNSIQLWDPREGALLRVLSGHTGRVTGAAFSPAGLLATSSRDGTARVWDPENGQVLRILTGHDGALRAVAFSPDGQWIATGGGDTTVRLWDAGTGDPIRTLRDHERTVTSLAFSSNGTRLVSGSADRTARVWNPATGSRIGSLFPSAREVYAVGFTPNGRYAVTGSGFIREQQDSDGNVISQQERGDLGFWRPGSGDHVQDREEQSGTIAFLAFAPTGRLLATGSGPEVRLRDPRTGESLRILRRGAAGFRSAAFAPDGSVLATGDAAGRIRFWRTPRGRLIRELVVPDPE